MEIKLEIKIGDSELEFVIGNWGLGFRDLDEGFDNGIWNWRLRIRIWDWD